MVLLKGRTHLTLEWKSGSQPSQHPLATLDGKRSYGYGKKRSTGWTGLQMDRVIQHDDGRLNGKHRYEHCAHFATGYLQRHPCQPAGGRGDRLFPVAPARLYGRYGDAAGDVWTHLRYVRARQALQSGLPDLRHWQHSALAHAWHGQYWSARIDYLPLDTGSRFGLPLRQ